jgi:hypothetical protein
MDESLARDVQVKLQKLSGYATEVMLLSRAFAGAAVTAGAAAAMHVLLLFLRLCCNACT